MFKELTAALAKIGVTVILKVIVILIVGMVAMKAVMAISKKTLMKSKLDEALHQFVLRIISIALWVVLIIAVLSALNINTTSLITVLGACGAAIALALKDSLSNVAGGMIIIMTKPFLKGEFIEVGGTSGVVDKIDLLTTHLHTVDNKCVTIPNGVVTTSVLTNYSRENIRRVDMVFQIAYTASVEKARNVICNVADANDMILKEPACFVGVGEHGESSISIITRVWCKTEHYFDVDFYMKEAVKAAFDRENITIPYNQMDVHIVNN